MAACCQGNVEPESFVIVDATINAPESLLIIIKIILVEMIMALVSGMPHPLSHSPSLEQIVPGINLLFWGFHIPCTACDVAVLFSRPQNAPSP